MIEAKLLTGNDNLSEVFDIRHKVFLDELQLPLIYEKDDLDKQAIHVVVYIKDKNVNCPVATGRIVFDGSICEIERICVLKEHRRNKYGDFAVRMLLNKAFISGISSVSVKTPKNIEKFFKSIGFYETTDEGYNINNEIKYLEVESNSIVKQCKNLSKNS